MPVVAKMPTWVAASGRGCRPRSRRRSRRCAGGRRRGRPCASRRNSKSAGSGRHDVGELGGQDFGLAELLGAGRRREVAEAAARRRRGRCAALVVQRMGAALAAGVVGQQRAGDALGPARLAVLGAVGDVDDAEQVAAARSARRRDEQLAEEQVLVGGGPEHAVEHVVAEDASLVVRHGRGPPWSAQAFRVRWKSRITRSTSSSDRPSRRKASRRSRRRSARSGPGSETTRWTAASG